MGSKSTNMPAASASVDLKRRARISAFIAAVCGLLLLADAVYVAHLLPFDFVGRVLKPVIKTPPREPTGAWVYMDFSSARPVASLEPLQSPGAGKIYLSFGGMRHGRWAPTSVSQPWLKWSLGQPERFQPIAPPPEVVAAFRTYLETQNFPRALEALDAADLLGNTDRRTLWSGYFHNAGALLLAILAFYSALRSAARFRQAARLALSLCPSCRYDLTGLSSTALTCPECGTPFNDAPRLNPQPAERAQEP